jgi:hypothetical protein
LVTDQIRDRAEKTLYHRWEKLGYDALLPAEQQYIALWWLVAEVMNGGFDQYFMNSSGDLAPVALEALKAVGATESLNILEQAMAIFGLGGYSIDREERWNKRRAIDPDGNAQIQTFDKLSRALEDSPEDFEGAALDRLAVIYSSNDLWFS